MATTDSTSASTEPRVITGWKRVAWPELRADPLETSVTSLPGPMLEISRDILEIAYQVVKRHDILPSLKDRDDRIHFEVRDGITTLLIVTPWSSEKTPIWEAALREIITSLKELTKETSICEGDIRAEIIAPELTQTIYYTYNNDPHLSATWDSVRPKVYKCLESFQATRHRMSSIALHRYGVLPELEANPATIYIGVDYRSDETGWNEVVADIKNMLRGEEGWGNVNVHMEHNENWAGPLFD